MQKTLLIFFFAIDVSAQCYARGEKYIIKINNQQEFDKIDSRLSNAILEGYTDITISICPGVYFFHNNHICRKKDTLSNVSLSINGRGSVITSFPHYDTEEIEDYAWSEVFTASDMIRVVDDEKKLCFLPYNNNISSLDKDKYSRLQLTEWFRAPGYNIKMIDDTGIFFIANDLKFIRNYGGKPFYNVHYDYIFKNIKSRFRLYNKHKAKDYLASTFLQLEDGYYKKITINNLHFSGGRYGAPLISINNINSNSILIRNCQFDHINGGVAYFTGTGNVVFKNNSITDTYGNELRFEKDCPNIRIINNKFKNCGRCLSNTFCVTCHESEYYIANNSFCDFGYGAIGVGVWHGNVKDFISRGIIEHNEVYFTPQYFINKEQHTLMDAGAIYVWTQNDEVIIRYNYIHDYTGMGENRGVFCDDGSNNVSIYGNIILNTPNSFSIDSRRVADQKVGFTNNANNLVANNIIDGPVCLMGYGESDRPCRKGINIVLNYGDSLVHYNVFYGLDVNEEDIVIYGCSSKFDGVSIPGRYRKMVRKFINDKFIKRVLREVLSD